MVLENCFGNTDSNVAEACLRKIRRQVLYLPLFTRERLIWTYRRQVGGTEARLPTKEVKPTLKSFWDFVLNHIPRVTGDVGLRCSWVFPRTSESGRLTGYRRRLRRASVSVGYDRRRVSDSVCGLPRPSSQTWVSVGLLQTSLSGHLKTSSTHHVYRITLNTSPAVPVDTRIVHTDVLYFSLYAQDSFPAVTPSHLRLPFSPLCLPVHTDVLYFSLYAQDTFPAVTPSHLRLPLSPLCLLVHTDVLYPRSHRCPILQPWLC
jgi:hypothetical protein